MKKLLTCLTAGFLIIGAQSLVAQSTNSPAEPGQHQGATPEQRKERMDHLLKALDLTKADLKGLSKEDRQAKLKDTATTVVADLKAKQSAGTLSEADQKRLEFLEKYLAHGGHQKAATPAN